MEAGVVVGIVDILNSPGGLVAMFVLIAMGGIRGVWVFRDHLMAEVERRIKAEERADRLETMLLRSLHSAELASSVTEKIITQQAQEAQEA